MNTRRLLGLTPLLLFAGCGSSTSSSTSASTSAPVATTPKVSLPPLVRAPQAVAATRVRPYRIGGDPWAATGAGGDLWVTDHNDGTLTRVDGGTGRVLSREPVAPKAPPPTGVAALSGRLGLGISGYDKHGNPLASVRTAGLDGHSLGPLRTGPSDTVGAFAAGGGQGYVGGFGYIARIPFAGGHAVTRRMPTGQVRAIGVGPGVVWAGVHDRSGSDFLVRLNPRTLAPTGQLYEPGPVTAIAPQGHIVWVASANGGAGRIDRIRASTATRMSYMVSKGPVTALALDATGVWALQYFESEVDHLVAASGKADRGLIFARPASTDLLPDNSPRGLAVLPGAVWVTDRESQTAYRIPVGRAP